MFSECTSLTNIDFSNFNTQYVTNMSYMFYKCISLTNIDLSSFNLIKAINASKMMFGDCYSLIYIENPIIYAFDHTLYRCNSLFKIVFKKN